VLESAGYEVRTDLIPGPAFLRRLKLDPPAAVVIDLSRLPSQGREAAWAIRHTAALRGLPLLFVDGDPVKVARIRDLLPDAAYTTWGDILGAVKRAIDSPPANPIVPESIFAAYSGTPLPRKLGIKKGFAVTLIHAPTDFVKTLGELPEGVVLSGSVTRNCSLILWFLRSRSELEKGIQRMATAAESRPLWIIWPKKSGSFVSDLTQQHVRKSGLEAGLVDYKICAVDATWSGLLFRSRKPKFE
jgi:hypothetical protein